MAAYANRAHHWYACVIVAIDLDHLVDSKATRTRDRDLCGALGAATDDADAWRSVISPSEVDDVATLQHGLIGTGTAQGDVVVVYVYSAQPISACVQVHDPAARGTT
jgi:hypothetical protein